MAGDGNGRIGGPIIAVEHLVARYGDKTILQDINLQVRRGEIFVIVGGSGSGKTTLLRHMIGLQRPFAGRVIVDGEDISDANEDRLRTMQRKIGVLFQAGALFGSLTLGENIALPLEEYTSLPPETIDLIVR